MNERRLELMRERYAAGLDLFTGEAPQPRVLAVRPVDFEPIGYRLMVQTHFGDPALVANLPSPESADASILRHSVGWTNKFIRAVEFTWVEAFNSVRWEPMLEVSLEWKRTVLMARSKWRRSSKSQRRKSGPSPG